jgi:hypothetical protein
MQARRLVALNVMTGFRSRHSLCCSFAPCWLYSVRSRQIAWLARDRSRIMGVPVVVTRLLGAVVPTTLAWSTVASDVLCPALVGQRSLVRPRLVLAHRRGAVITL